MMHMGDEFSRIDPERLDREAADSTDESRYEQGLTVKEDLGAEGLASPEESSSPENDQTPQSDA